MNHRPLLRSLLLGLVAFASLSLGCDGPASSNPPQAQGQPAPALTGVDLQGRPVDLEQLSGKVVIVDFWASWCEPCEELMPALERIAAEFGERVVIIGVSVDDDADAMRGFVERVGVSFTVVHDHDHAIADRWAPPKMPTTYVIDQRGTVARVHDSESAASLRADVEALLGGG